MKQKIVIKVELHCHRCRNKALKLASSVYGVASVAIDGEDRDKVVVIGEDVDPAALMRCLRKKFDHATIDSVEKLRPDHQQPANRPPEQPCPPCGIPVPPMCAPPQFVVYENYPPPNTCSIM